MKCEARHRKNRRRATSRRGATAVEFALTAPIFFLFLLAAFEFGWLNVIRHTADNAAYEAARTAMVPGATAAEATAKANSILNIVGARGATVTVTPATMTTDTDEVTVAIDIPMNSNGLDRAAVHVEDDAAQRIDAADRAGRVNRLARYRRLRLSAKPQAASEQQGGCLAPGRHGGAETGAAGVGCAEVVPPGASN